MNKCVKCQCEFEGNFCPDCGEKWQEVKKCPGCGAEVKGSVKFCNICGYSFIQSAPPPAAPLESVPAVQTAAAATVPKTAKQAKESGLLGGFYVMLKFIPSLVFALFAVLLFIFYSASVAIMPGGELLGETIKASSYGNVYDLAGGLIEELPDIQGAMIGLIILAVTALLFAIGSVSTLLAPAAKNKEINLFKKFKLSLNQLLNFISFVFYLIFFIIGCVISSKITAFDEGMGVLATGSCPKLLIAFSIIFALLSAAAMTGRVLIKKHKPAIAEAEEKAKAETTEKYNAKLSKFFALNPAPYAPKKVEKPASRPPEPEGLLKDIQKVSGMKKLIGFICFLMPLIGGSITLLVFSITEDLHIGFLILAINVLPASVLISVAVIVSGARRITKWDPENSRRNGGMITTIIFCSVLIAAVLVMSTYVIIVNTVTIQIKDEFSFADNKASFENTFGEYTGEIIRNENNNCYVTITRNGKKLLDNAEFVFQDVSGSCKYTADKIEITMFIRAPIEDQPLKGYFDGGIEVYEFPFLVLGYIFSIAYFVIFIIAAANAIKKNNKLKLAFYGEKKPAKNKTPVLTFEEINQDYITYKENRDRYKAYRVQKTEHKHKMRKYRRGSTKPTPKAVIWMDLHKAALIVVSLLLAAAIAFSSIFLPMLLTKFKVSKVEQIKYASSGSSVIEILGEPDGQFKTDSKWQYFDKNYTKILKKIAQNGEKSEAALEKGDESALVKLALEETKLASQLKNVTTKYIEINFSNKNDASFVSSVLLDTKHCESAENTKKEVKDLVLSSSNLSHHSINDNTFFTASIYYTDNSYKMLNIISHIISALNTGNDSFNVTWSDAWGEYTIYCSKDASTLSLSSQTN